jgi:hypothetical protein
MCGYNRFLHWPRNSQGPRLLRGLDHHTFENDETQREGVDSVSSALKQSAHARIAIAAGLMAALILMFAAAPKAHAAKGMEITIQDDALFLNNQYAGAGGINRDQGLALLPAIEVSRLRMNLVWAVANGAQAQSTKKPSKPTYDFTKWDSAIAAATAKGYKINLTLMGPAPAWAAGDKKITGAGSVKPDAKAYGDFVSQAVKHFKGKVDTYSIWNEPNHRGSLQSKSGSAAGNAPIYRALYDAGYKAAKKADSKANVWFGELAPYGSKKGVAIMPLEFLRDMFCLSSRNTPTKGKCPTLKADSFAYHPYDFEAAPNKKFNYKTRKGLTSRDAANVVTMANLGDLTKLVDALQKNKRLVKTKGSSKFDIQLTEFGYFAAQDGSKVKVFPASTRAKYLVQAFEIAQKNPRVKSMLQFLLPSYPSGLFRFNTSIVTQDGKPTAPYTALQKYAAGAVKKKLIKDGPSGRR